MRAPGAGVPAVLLRAETRPTDLLRPVQHPKPYDPLDDAGANVNLAIGTETVDPVSGKKMAVRPRNPETSSLGLVRTRLATGGGSHLRTRLWKPRFQCKKKRERASKSQV
jgi:hypothetical protein